MILLLIKLFLTFMKIALFNFGGGFVMIPLIHSDVLAFGITDTLFKNIIAISQMTPGAIAINTATYVGYMIMSINYGTSYGFLGALVTTLAIPIPSFLIVIFISPILVKYKDHPLNKMIFYGIRAVIVGLIINAAVIVAKSPLFAYENKEQDVYSRFQIMKIFNNPHFSHYINMVNLGSIGIFLISLFLLIKYKLNPIFVIIISAVLGIVIFQFNV